MANKLFQELDLHNKPKRNGFDLSHRINFTAKAGELLPVDHHDVIIGDNWRMSINHFTRTAPADTAAAVKIREYFDVFFVPYRLLWKNAPAVHTQNTRNPVSASMPNANLPIGSTTPTFSWSDYFNSEGSTYGYFSKLASMKNMFGYNRGFMSAKLMNHLGYNYLTIEDIGSLADGGSNIFSYNGPNLLSAYPLLAYQCIYYNFFRNSQWENNQPYNYNVDYMSNSTQIILRPQDSTWLGFWNNPTLFDLQYANYPKDLFFGFFPESQYGDPAEVDGSLSSRRSDGYIFPPISASSGGQLSASPVSGTDKSQLDGGGSSAPSGPLVAEISPSILSDFSSSFNILQLRQAQFLQKYREIRGSGQQTYANIVAKIFGVNIPQTLDTTPLYLGGYSSTISFSEVENTNLTGSNQADIKGKGTGGGQMRTINFSPKENGCIMIIYHAMPVVDYALTALHFDNVRTEADDFANPLFDQLGFQELPYYFLDSTVYGAANPSDFGVDYIGFTTRYFDYKTAVDRTLGDFRETSKTWLAPIDFNYLRDYIVDNMLSINANFFKINPAVLDPIFSLKAAPTEPSEHSYVPADTVATDQLRVFANLNISVIRPLDKDGVPY